MNVNIHTTVLVSWWDAREGSTQSNKSAYGVGGDGMEVTVEEKRGMTIEWEMMQFQTVKVKAIAMRKIGLGYSMVKAEALLVGGGI
jgi:hypothetical protein